MQCPIWRKSWRIRRMNMVNTVCRYFRLKYKTYTACFQYRINTKNIMTYEFRNMAVVFIVVLSWARHWVQFRANQRLYELISWTEPWYVSINVRDRSAASYCVLFRSIYQQLVSPYPGFMTFLSGSEPLFAERPISPHHIPKKSSSMMSSQSSTQARF